MCPGGIEIAGSTKELFRNPVTVGAARLTGCKNLSRAEILSDHELYAADWGVRLHVADVITEGVTYVGLRAHDFAVPYGGAKHGDGEDILPGNVEKSNVMNCALERITEAPFEIYLILRNVSSENLSAKPDLQPIWWKLSKKEWEEMQEKIPEAIYFPPEKLILLKEEIR